MGITSESLRLLEWARRHASRCFHAGLVLLALDWTFRLAQWLHPSFVTGRFVTSDKSVITIHLTWKKVRSAKR